MVELVRYCSVPIHEKIILNIIPVFTQIANASIPVRTPAI
jgi:hypothetical protein